ncbi:MAG: hypothetical protein ACXQS8_05960 [Candidatus Helarchaeales archaeon]
MVYPRKFREVMKKRTIDDLTLKKQLLRRASNEQIVELFFSMCDWAIQIRSGQFTSNRPRKVKK